MIYNNKRMFKVDKTIKDKPLVVIRKILWSWFAYPTEFISMDKIDKVGKYYELITKFGNRNPIRVTFDKEGETRLIKVYELVSPEEMSMYSFILSYYSKQHDQIALLGTYHQLVPFAFENEGGENENL